MLSGIFKEIAILASSHHSNISKLKAVKFIPNKKEI